VAYRLKRSETPRRGLRRIAREELDLLAAELADPALDPYARAHQARRRFKRLRALLRLFRGGLGATFRAEDAWYRDAARTLAPFRDAEALVETLTCLLDRDPALRGAAGVAGLLMRLAHEREVLAETEHLEERLAALADGVAAARERMAGWRLRGKGYRALAEGIERTAGRARRAFDRALAEGGAEARHAWRREAKYHALHVKLLTGMWPAVLRRYGREVEELVDLLGAEHNLVLLLALAEAELPGPGLDALREAAQRAQDALLARAVPLGRRIHAERPAALRRRFGAYWEIWRLLPDPAQRMDDGEGA
jgi:hypothetical protein